MRIQPNTVPLPTPVPAKPAPASTAGTAKSGAAPSVDKVTISPEAQAAAKASQATSGDVDHDGDAH